MGVFTKFCCCCKIDTEPYDRLNVKDEHSVAKLSICGRRKSGLLILLSVLFDIGFFACLCWMLFNIANDLKPHHDWWFAMPVAYMLPIILTISYKSRYICQLTRPNITSSVAWNAKRADALLYVVISQTFMIMALLVAVPYYLTIIYADFKLSSNSTSSTSQTTNAKQDVQHLKTVGKHIFQHPSSISMLFLYVVCIMFNIAVSSLHRKRLVAIMREFQTQNSDSVPLHRLEKTFGEEIKHNDNWVIENSTLPIVQIDESKELSTDTSDSESENFAISSTMIAKPFIKSKSKAGRKEKRAKRRQPSINVDDKNK